MKLLPRDTFTLSTADSLPVVLQRLTAQVEAPKGFRFSRQHAPYEGTVSEQGFQINRIIHYRNSFLPVIRGRFEPEAKGTLIYIQMGLHPFVMAFLGFWVLAWYSGVIPMILLGAMPVAIAALFAGIPLLMLVIFGIAFWTEAKRSRRELTQILQGEKLES
ncbi:MAG: hypothetical protein VKJ46_04440 [Leptolyngbyaceae bacterium]|nr:hypothetical protein [Leptolyngbyaceae bacterium]